MKKKRIVSRGRIKVDARRAVAKLREHLLLDPDAWPLEVVRVAAMCGATGVSVEHDADDLRIAFDGTPPASDRLARLLDFALEGSRDPAVRALRLLAVALNATISTRPRRVTVAVRDDAAGDARFTFDTTLHQRDGEGEAAASADHALLRTPVSREDLRGASVVIEMNKGFSWGTFVRFAAQRPLREVVLLHEATRRAALPISFVPELPAPETPAPVMIVSLEKHGVAGGVLEVRADVGSGPRVTFLEHGVTLADVALPSSLAIPVEGHGVHLPVDVHVDAEAWPTNASRSQVHAREVTRVVEAIHAALPAIGRALGAIAQGTEPALDGIVKHPTRSQAERAAAAFACCAVQGGQGGPLAPMLDLPLARDAVGRPLSVGRIAALARRAVESAGAERVFVHRGAEPLPEAFAPFAGDVVWLGSSLADRILSGVHTRDFADVHRDVAAGIARRDAWLRQPATGPHVAPSSTELLRLAVMHDSGELAGLRGEVVVHVGRRDPPSARVFVEGRVLASVQLAGTLPIEAAISWPGRLRPTLSFDAVVNDASLQAALHEVERAAAAALASRADVLGADDAPPATRALARAALAADPDVRRGPLAAAPVWPTAAGGWVSLRDVVGGGASTPEGAGSGSVARAPVPSRIADFLEQGAGRSREKSSTPERSSARGKSSTPEASPARGKSSTPEASPARGKSSTPEASPAPGKSSTPEASPARPVAIAFVQRAPERGGAVVPGGRVVLVLDAVDVHRLRAALDRELVLVPFGPAMGRVDEGEHRPVGDALEKLLVDALAAEGSERSLVVAFRQGSVRGLCATATRGRVIHTFAGIALLEAPTPDELPAILVLEDDRAFPTPKWDGLLSAPPLPTAAALVQLADAVRASVGSGAESRPGDVVSLAHAGIGAAERRDLRAWTIAALGAVGGPTRAKSKLARTLADIPCVAMFDEHGDAAVDTATSFRRSHPGSKAPYLQEPPGFPTAGWRPLVVASRSEVVGLERALGCELEDGARERDRRFELYELEVARRRILAQPAQPFASPVPGALPGSPTGSSVADKRNALRALVALRTGSPTTSAAPCTLRYSGRYVADVSLGRVPTQIVAVLDTTNAGHVEKWAGITAVGREVAIAAVLDASKALVASLLADAAGQAFESTALGTPVGCQLVTSLVRGAPSLIPKLQESTVTLETAFGGRVALGTAWGDGPVPIARRAFPPEAADRVAQAPLLLEPRHAALEQLLQAAGLALQDITRALAEATGDHAAPARLSGTPGHPAFRARFSELGVDDIDGELELSSTADAGIEILVLGDTVRTGAPDLPFGVRAIARSKRLDTRPKAIREIAARIGKAATRHLEGLAPSVEDLPPLAADCIRASIAGSVEAEEKVPRALRDARAFVDTSGRAWSFAALLAHRIRFTTNGPPYPATARAEGDEPAVLRLEASFATALRKLGGRGVFDVTSELVLDAEAEARAAAPPVPAKLADDTLRGCFAVAEIEDDTTRGQLGLLVPVRGDRAGVSVHVAGRPVCTLGAPSGWPVVAVVDDTSLVTNRRRDGLAPTSQAERVIRRVMQRRDELIAKRAAAPTYVFASIPVRRSFQAFDVMGTVWLESEDPQQPGTVSLHWSGRSEAQRESAREQRALDGPLTATTLNPEARDGVPGWRKGLPVSGTLFVSPSAPHAVLDGAARSLLGSVVADTLPALLEQPGPAGSVLLEQWKWAAALWGASLKTAPARDASGAMRGTVEILRELRRRGVIWCSRHAGVADGAFPEAAPSFILLDDGKSPLLDLLSTHAPALVEELGAPSSTPERAAERATSSTPESDADQRPAKRRRRKRRAAEQRDAATRVLPPGAPRQEAPERSAEVPSPSEPAATSPTWISRVGSLVADWTGTKPLESLDPSHPLVVALAAAADRLGRPLPQVAIVDSGRPVTYSPQKDVLRVHLAHPTVAELLQRGEVELLAAAALGELNRALEAVSDAEEARGVVALLERRAERRST